MSFGYSTNQYEHSFKAKRLLNWHVPRLFTKFPKTKQGFSQFFADDKGYLLTGAPRSAESPWGTFISTWDMPLKIPPSNPKYTGRLKSEQLKLRNWREKSTLQHHCNGFLEYPTNKYPSTPHSPVTHKKRPGNPPPPNTTPVPDMEDEEMDLTPFEDVRPGHTPGPHGSLSHTGVHKLLPPISRMSSRLSMLSEDGEGELMEHARVGVDGREAQVSRAKLRRSQSRMKAHTSLNDRYNPQHFGTIRPHTSVRQSRNEKKSVARNSQVTFANN